MPIVNRRTYKSHELVFRTNGVHRGVLRINYSGCLQVKHYKSAEVDTNEVLTTVVERETKDFTPYIFMTTHLPLQLRWHGLGDQADGLTEMTFSLQSSNTDPLLCCYFVKITKKKNGYKVFVEVSNLSSVLITPYLGIIN